MNKLTRIAAALAAACIAWPLAAQEEASPSPSPDTAAEERGLRIETGLYGIYDNQANNEVSALAQFSLSFASEHFSLVSALDGANDGKYGPELADIPGGNFGDLYCVMREGSIGLRQGAFSARGGRLRAYDAVDSPYSLFLNSRGLSANGADIRYDDGKFYYESRWIELNSGSAPQGDPVWPSGFPDRGANVKTFAVTLGELRLGFQDASVYSGRSFSAEYFLSPVAQYFIQYVLNTGGRPWVNEYDDNYIMGAFAEWKRPGSFYLYAQALLDDFGLHFLSDSFNDNPWQMALSAGGRLETEVGSFGLYCAMATKYTFAPSQVGLPYGYTYYPETRFDIDRQTSGFQAGEIGIEDNEIGYKYGENNLALQVDWKGKAAGLDLGASLEFRLAGSNSPANPWGDLQNQDTTHWLDDPVLEKRVLAGASASYGRGAWTYSAALVGGVAFDALSLGAPAVDYGASVSDEDDIYLYAPVEGNTVPVLKLELGCRYSWKAR